MSQPAFGSELRRHRRERLLAAAEAVEGVVAASADFTTDGVLDSVRVVVLPSGDATTIRQAVAARLKEHGFRFDADAIDVRRMGMETAPRQPETAPSAPRNELRPQPDDSPPPAASRPVGRAAQRPGAQKDERPRLQLIEDEGPPPPWHGRFLVLDGVDVQRRQNRITCTVRITRLGETFTAEAEDIDSPTSRARCAARAALMAAQQAGQGIQLSLEGVALQDFFGRQYVIAFVDAAANRRWSSLSGILAVDNSIETSAVLAILRAVERWVAW